jgi:hypothetical protein
LEFWPQTRNIEASLGKGVAFVQDAGVASERLAYHPSKRDSSKDMASLVSDCTTANIGMSACEPDFEYIGRRAFAVIFADLSFIVDLSINGVFTVVFEGVQAPVIDVIVEQGNPRRDTGGFA